MYILVHCSQLLTINAMRPVLSNFDGLYSGALSPINPFPLKLLVVMVSITTSETKQEHVLHFISSSSDPGRHHGTHCTHSARIPSDNSENRMVVFPSVEVYWVYAARLFPPGMSKEQK